MAGKILVFKKNGSIEVRKSNLAATASETPNANVGSASGGSGGSSSPERTRSEVGRRKIEAIARALMKKQPARFKSLAQAVAHVTRNNTEGAATIFKDYCVGPSAGLTEQEHERPSATERILKGCEAAPGKNFTERLEKVLAVWPELAEAWYRDR